jgi:hypothetical protein
MNDNKQPTQSDAEIVASVDAALDGMSHRKRREFFIKMVAESSLADVKAQRQAFEAQLVERAAEIDEIDRIDAHDIRQIYADTIAAKENTASRAITVPLVLVVFGGLGMWAGIANGNGWVIAASVCLLLWALARISLSYRRTSAMLQFRESHQALTSDSTQRTGWVEKQTVSF